MSKITKIISIVSILVVNFLFLIYIEEYESKKYTTLNGYNIESISITYNDDRSVARDNLKQIVTLANKNNVILQKVNVNSSDVSKWNVYISAENINQLISLLKNNFKINLTKNDYNNKSFISTYIQQDSNQIGKINDFLNNDYYNYYLIDKLIDDGNNVHGTYFVFYKDWKDYSNFLNQANEFLGYDTKANIFTDSLEMNVLFVMFVSLTFLLLFYFIFQMYEYYSKSKKIGCMKLLGFKNKSINKKLIKSTLKLMFVTMIGILTFIIFFVENISYTHFFSITLINGVVLLLIWLISFISCRIINKKYDISNIIKRQNIAKKVCNMSYKFKSIMIIIIIILGISFANSLRDLQQYLKIYNTSKNLLDYGIFETFVADQPELSKYENQHKLYLDIINDKRLETFYAHFPGFTKPTEEDILEERKLEEEGAYYYYGSVDKQYIKKENIIIYDLDGNTINANKLNRLVFLFPKSKKKYINMFEKYYREQSKFYYENKNLEFEFIAYLYDDRNLNTYKVDINSKIINSPILRVVDESIDMPYFHEPLGISFFGNQLNTGLKIKVDDNTWSILEQHIENNNLSNLLTKDNFISYKNYFSDEIRLSKILLFSLLLGSIIVLLIYILITSQIVILFIKSEHQKIIVKKMLGFEYKKIYKKLLKKSFIHIFVSVVISFIILLIAKKINPFIFILFCTLIILLDLLINIIISNCFNFSKLNIDLKGGTYD